MVKSLADLQSEQKAGLRSLADLNAERKGEEARGVRDPIFGRKMPYKIDLPGTPLAGQFTKPEDRDVLGDPDETAFGTVTGIKTQADAAGKLERFYILDLGLPPEIAVHDKDLVSEALFGEKLTPDAAGERIRQNYRNGQIQVQLADLGMQVLGGRDTPATWKEIERLRRGLGTDFRAAFRPWWEKMLSSTAEQLPLMGEGIEAAPLGATVGAVAGGLVGLTIGAATPTIGEEAPLGLSLMWSGAKLGGGLATAHRIGQLEAGGAILDLLDMGVDPAIAKATAAGIGVLNGALETLEIGTLIKTLPGGKGLLRRGIAGVVKRMAKEGTLRNLAAQHAARFGTYLSAETLQELAQESVSITGEELDKYLTEQLQGRDIPRATIEEIVERYKEIGAKSLQSFTVLGIPGTALSAGLDVYASRASAADRMMPDGRTTEVPMKGESDAVQGQGRQEGQVAAAAAIETGQGQRAGQGGPGAATQTQTPPALPEPGDKIKPRAGYVYRAGDFARDFIGMEDRSYSSGIEWYEGNGFLVEYSGEPVSGEAATNPEAFRGDMSARKVTRVYYEPEAYIEEAQPKFMAELQKLREQFPDAQFIRLKTIENPQTGDFERFVAPAASERGEIENQKSEIENIESSLEEMGWQDLVAKAKQIGLKVRGKKAQLAALIADAIKAKAGIPKRTKMERNELKATEEAIKKHPVYQSMLEGSQYVPADIESGLENRTRAGRVDPTGVYFVDPAYKGEVEGFTGEPGGKDFDKEFAAHITYDRTKGQAWDDAASEQGLGVDLSGFLQSLADALAAMRPDKAGIFPAALDRALAGDDPYLAMLVEKRRLLQSRASPYDVNQALHKIAAKYRLTREEYSDLLMGEGMIANPDDPHPGSMTFEDFFQRLGRELADRDSPWLKQWGLDFVEKPKEMYQRLKTEWEGIAATGLSQELTVGEVVKAASLTDEQRAELETIDAEKVATQILKQQKEIIVGRLISDTLDDAAEIKSLRNGLLRAWRSGKRQGVQEARDAYRAGRQKLRANQRLRDYIGKLLRYIKKPAGATIGFEYRRAIAMIQDGIDPHFRRKSTIDTRQASREYFKEHPAVYVPEKVLRDIEAKSPSEMTVSELEEVARQVRILRHKGRISRDLADRAREQKAADDKTAFLDAIGRGGTWSPEDPGPIIDRPEEPVGRKVGNWLGLTLTPERLFDALEGGKDFAGVVFRMFWDRAADAMASKLRMVKARRDAFNAEMEHLGLKLRDLTEIILTVSGREYSVQQVIGLYNFTRNLKTRLAVTFGNRISMADQTRVVEFVENERPKLKELADWIVQHYDTRYPEMRQVTIDVFGFDPGREENYTPMRRMEVDFVPDERQIREELEGRYHLERAYVEHGFAIRRKDIPDQYQKPVRLDAVNVLLEQIEREEHEIAFAPLVKELNGLVHDEEVKPAIIDKVGRAGWERVKNYIDAVANPNIYRTYHMVERLAQSLRVHAAIAFLAYKVSTMLLQVPSVMLYLPEAGYHLVLASMRAATDWSAVRQFVVENDPMVDFPVLEREWAEMTDSKAWVGETVKAVGEWGMQPLIVFDAVARTIGWYGTYLATYEKQIAAGTTEQAASAEAVRVARHTTTRTQPGARAYELPEMYRTSMYVNVVLQFTNQINKMWNMTVHDMPAAWRNGHYRRAVATFAALGINGLLTWTIANGRLPEDEEDLLDAAGEQFIGSIPFVGVAMVEATHGFGSSGIPMIEGTAKLFKAGLDTMDNLAKGKIEAKTIAKAVEGLAPIVGIPWTGPKRIWEFLTSGQPRKLITGRKEKKHKIGSGS